MARIPYVPYTEIYDAIFSLCGIDVPTPTDFGGNQGWDQATFQGLINAARAYLDDESNWDDIFDQISEDQYEQYYDLLRQQYPISYWSTELPTF